MAKVTGNKTVNACPGCDSSNVYYRERDHDREPYPDDEKWKCRDCEDTFPEPNQRPEYVNGSTPDHIREMVCQHRVQNAERGGGWPNSTG